MGQVLQGASDKSTIFETDISNRHADGPRVFSRFYSINTGAGHDGSARGESGRKNSVEGLNSPWGQRGEICQHFGWTYDYLLRGIAWINVQLMLADGARMKTGEKGKPQEPTHRMNNDELKAFFNNRNALRNNK